MPLTAAERGRLGGQARYARMDADQRKAVASKAWLASCAAAICKHGDQLTPEWRVRLAALVASWSCDEGGPMADP